MRFNGQIFSVLVATLLSVVATSCGGEDTPEPVPDGDDYMTIAFTLKVSSDTDTRGTTWGDEYTQDGTTYDNVVNTDDVHVAILRSDNTVLNIEDLRIFESGSGRYTYLGEIKSSDYTIGETYRCMVVANTGNGDVDFSQLESLTYQATALPNADNHDNFYIPMWGVKSFTITTYREDTQNLGEIEMLRAAVKCRIRFSDDLLAANETLALSDVKFVSRNIDGYVVPKGFNTVASTTDLDYIDCFNPTEAQESVKTVVTETTSGGFIIEDIDVDPNSIDFFDETPYITSNSRYATFTDGSSQCAIAYFPECKNLATNSVYISLSVTQGTITDTYTVPFVDTTSGDLLEHITRNHTYDFEIISINKGLAIKLSNYWTQKYKGYSFDESLTWKDYGGGEYISWSNYETKINKIITLLNTSTNTLHGEAQIYTPVGATWIATLTSNDASDSADAIVFTKKDSEGNEVTSSSISGIVDGINTMSFDIKPTNNDNATQHISTLTFYIKYLTGRTQEIEKLSGWTIIQQRSL